MTIAVRYQSRGGTTKDAAEVIAKTLGTEAKPVSEAIQEPVDLLFLGGGVYVFNADKELLDFLSNIDTSKVKKIAAFSTSGCMNTTIKRIKKCAKKAKIPISSSSLCLKMFGLGKKNSGKDGSRLTESQIKQAEDFANKVKAEI